MKIILRFQKEKKSENLKKKEEFQSKGKSGGFKRQGRKRRPSELQSTF